jgi:apolipoprotein N-acyltransferase
VPGLNEGQEYNALLVMTAQGRIAPGAVYAKRKRVPFGEYVPLRDWFPFLGKVVPIGDIARGIFVEPLALPLADGRNFRIGGLICYEDIFPALARDEAQRGVDFFTVVTNDAWYGEEGGALQHAEHAVLRAIETGRPVLRCGNDGWSGWIDERGFARSLEKGADGQIGLVPATFGGGAGTTYFRGAGVVAFYADPAYAGRETFYVRFGDWFVALSALLLAGGAWTLRSAPANGFSSRPER